MRAVPDTVIVFTTGMERLASFYRQGFDLGEPETGPGHTGFSLPNLYLGFDQVEEAYPAPAAVTLWFRVDDLEATYLRLLDLGGTSKYGPVEKRGATGWRRSSTPTATSSGWHSAGTDDVTARGITRRSCGVDTRP